MKSMPVSDSSHRSSHSLYNLFTFCNYCSTVAINESTILRMQDSKYLHLHRGRTVNKVSI